MQNARKNPVAAAKAAQEAHELCAALSVVTTGEQREKLIDLLYHLYNVDGIPTNAGVIAALSGENPKYHSELIHESTQHGCGYYQQVIDFLTELEKF